jgi:hypothetical protein
MPPMMSMCPMGTTCMPFMTPVTIGDRTYGLCV